MLPKTQYITHPQEVPIHIEQLPPDILLHRTPPDPPATLTATTPPSTRLSSPLATPLSTSRSIPSVPGKAAASDSKPDTSYRQSINSLLSLSADSLMQLGGLKCMSFDKFKVGHLVSICIPEAQPEFIAIAQVSWRRNHEQGYELGLAFLDAQQAYRVRMVEQSCYIHLYQQQVAHQEGRQLSQEEAALEWIQRYGSHFPRGKNY